MDLKHNESTPNRPQGERVLDASYLFADLPAYEEQLKEEKGWKEKDRNSITVFKSSGLTVVLVLLKKGATVPDNTLSGFFTVQVVNGRVDARIGDRMIQAAKGLLVLHPGIRHSLDAVEDSVLLFTHYHQNTGDEGSFDY